MIHFLKNYFSYSCPIIFFSIHSLCNRVIDSQHPDFLYAEENTRDCKTNLYSPVCFSNLSELKSSLNLEAECSPAFENHQIEFNLPEVRLNATAKTYSMVVNK